MFDGDIIYGIKEHNVTTGTAPVVICSGSATAAAVNRSGFFIKNNGSATVAMSTVASAAATGILIPTTETKWFPIGKTINPYVDACDGTSVCTLRVFQCMIR